MAEIIAFVSNGIVSSLLLGYILILWIGLTFWTGMDIFSRTDNWFMRLGSIFLVGVGFIFGFVLYLIIRPQATIEEAKLRDFEERLLESQSKVTICPKCENFVRDEFLFCSHCGYKIKTECFSCKQILDINWNQCPYCGVLVAPTALPTIKEVSSLANGKANGSLFRSFVKIFSTPEVQVQKRGRGRPRKNPPIEGPIVKRGRGRPRKYENPTASEIKKD